MHSVETAPTTPDALGLGLELVTQVQLSSST